MCFAHSPGINEPELTPASSACSQGGSPRTNLPPPKCRNGLRFSTLHQNVGRISEQYSGFRHQQSQDKQPASFSEQTKNWLREGHKDMPWHNIDSVAVSNMQDNSDINGAPSDTAATQGSDK
ncbi:hypothetical protein BFJ71_g12215 [Fusarium oxysporum]|nr:hypothetical protein BFJ71_g12215 [Fusarium oxysporum]